MHALDNNIKCIIFIFKLKWLSLTCDVFAWFLSHFNDNQFPILHRSFSQVVESGYLRAFLMDLVENRQRGRMVMVDVFEIICFCFTF